MTSLIQAPGKQHNSLRNVSGQQMGAAVPLRSESHFTIIHCVFLIVVVVIQRDHVALLSCSVSPDMTGLSLQSAECWSSSAKAPQAFGVSLFLLQGLAIASFHLSAVLATILSLSAGSQVLGCFTAGCGSATNCAGIIYHTPSQPPSCYAAFSSSSTAQPPAAGGPPPEHSLE